MEKREASPLTAIRPRTRPRVGSAEVALFIRGTTMLSLVAASLTACVAQLRGGDWITTFATANAIPRKSRVILLNYQAGVVILVGIMSGAYWWRARSKGGLTNLIGASRLVGPLLLSCLVAPLVLGKDWDPFVRACSIVIFVIAFEQLARGTADEMLRARRAAAKRLLGATSLVKRFASRARLVGRSWALAVPSMTVGVGASLYALFASHFTILRHRHFETASNDLGQYDNAFWNALHGHPFRCTALVREGDWAALRSHAELTMYALLPAYALFPRAETLLVLQSVALGSAAIPIYRLAARRLPRAAAATLALAYLLYAPMHGANFYDVHFQTFGAVFTAWAMDFLDEGRVLAFAVAFILALGSREDISVGFAVLGAYLMLSGRRPRTGAALAVFSAAYFGVLKFAIMPRFGTFWYADIYKQLFPSGEATYRGVIWTLLSNPLYVLRTLVTTDKLQYLLQILAPLAFLPLRGRWLWMSLLPGAFFTLLTTGYGPTVQISFQYVAYNIPYLFAAAAVALATRDHSRAERARQVGALSALIVGTLLSAKAWGAIPRGSDFRGGFGPVDFGAVTEAEVKRDRALHDLAAQVPAAASLAVSEMDLPHVSNRLTVYDLRDGYGEAEYLLYSDDSGGYGADRAREGIAKGLYAKVTDRDGVVLLRRSEH